MQLIGDFPPEHVGAYQDIGHLALDGEYLPMGLAMMHDYLSIVGIKDPYYAPQPTVSSPSFQPKFAIAGHGCIDWHSASGFLERLVLTDPSSSTPSMNWTISCSTGWATQIRSLRIWRPAQNQTPNT